MKVYIDAGHGGFTNSKKRGYNTGAAYNGRKESEDVFQLAQAVADTLIFQPNVEVRMSRTADEDPELMTRCRDANAWGADYFISIHRNAFAPNKASGVEAWIYSKAAKNGDAWTKAARFVDGLCKVTGLTNRGVHLGAPNYTDYAVNNYTNMTSCLLEVGFVDNDKDNAAFDKHFAEMVEVIAEGLCKAVGVEYIKKGDVNGDGKVDVEDARKVLRAAVGLENLNSAETKRADVDGDGKVTVADARAVLRESVGLE